MIALRLLASAFLLGVMALPAAIVWDFWSRIPPTDGPAFLILSGMTLLCVVVEGIGAAGLWLAWTIPSVTGDTHE